ncbi:hypothetical protein [Nostoc sp.]
MMYLIWLGNAIYTSDRLPPFDSVQLLASSFNQNSIAGVYW